MAFINGIINVSDIECRNLTRMCRAAFFDLRDKLVSSRKLVVTRGVSVEEQLLLFTRMLSYSIQNRPIRYYLGRSGETINRHFHRVLRAILGLYSELVKYPTADYINQMPIQHREYFKDCIGAIDGTHIPTMIPLQEQGKWRNRKHEITQNVLAVVGHDMKFHYVLAGWEGSATDARVMQSALTRSGDPLKVPDGKYYVVDCGYANAPGFLAPYRNSKYNQSTYQDNHRPQDPKELFNHQHASVRNVVERVFGLLKGRFPILKVAPHYPIATQVKLVIACCILHNHIIGFDHDESFIDLSKDGDSSAHNALEAEPFHYGAYGPSTREERNTWASFRDDLASRMWNDLPRSSRHRRRT